MVIGPPQVKMHQRRRDDALGRRTIAPLMQADKENERVLSPTAVAVIVALAASRHRPAQWD
jgi:hypothetical protein